MKKGSKGDSIFSPFYGWVAKTYKITNIGDPLCENQPYARGA